MAYRILYVCTYWGVRSQIAKLLTDALAHPSLEVQSAGFENGIIGELPRKLMSERGLELKPESPETLFMFARKHQFDYVVTLCNQFTQENYTILYDVVEQLFGTNAEIVHWNIPDFMSIDASGDERVAAGREIIDQIDDEVRKFVAQLDLPQSTAANSP